MIRRTLTGLYDSYADAARTVAALQDAGIPYDDISIVARHADAHASAAGSDAAAGAAMGGIAGGAAGLLAGLGMLAIPGIGPVVAAGWLVATAAGAVVGAGTGAATGGLIGALTGAGVSAEHAHVYAESLRRGGAIVTVRADETQAGTALTILRAGAIDPVQRGARYRDAGWVGFDAMGEPYPTVPGELVEPDRRP